MNGPQDQPRQPVPDRRCAHRFAERPVHAGLPPEAPYRGTAPGFASIFTVAVGPTRVCRVSCREQEWEKIWEAGIEVGARFELGQAVNSSIYYLLSSIRAGDYETNSSRFGSAFRVKSYR